MRHIIKQTSPPEFEAWKKANNPKNFNALNSKRTKVKLDGVVDYSNEELKATLLKEQNNLCCYCNTSIKNDQNTPIEHLKPKEGTKNQHLIFDYDNLLASCDGNKKDPKPRDLHCDAKKNKNTIPLTPLMLECETEIIYAENGIISGLSDRASQTIETLNLGCNKLNEEREDIILGFLYEDAFNTVRISELEAKKIYESLSKTKSEPYIIAILQVLKQNFN